MHFDLSQAVKCTTFVNRWSRLQNLNTISMQLCSLLFLSPLSCDEICILLEMESVTVLIQVVVSVGKLALVLLLAILLCMPNKCCGSLKLVASIWP